MTYQYKDDLHAKLGKNLRQLKAIFFSRLSFEIPKPISSESEFTTVSKTYRALLVWDLCFTFNDFGPNSVSVSSNSSMTLQLLITKGLFPVKIDPSAVTYKLVNLTRTTSINNGFQFLHSSLW
jgi:hypothetical protein